jgi:MoaA/NifB/PqqE/SkfB family radical SAM enzyme
MGALNYLQLANAYAQSLWAYSTNGKPRPFSASYVVSNQCNIHCSYCNFPSMTKAQLSLQQIETLFDKLQRMGVQRLGLLGGEPLLRKDIHEIVQIAKLKKLFVSMNSNLLLYDKHKERLQNVDMWFTSIDGTPEKHFANRGKQDFDRILKAIRHIRSQNKQLIAICVVTEPEKHQADYLISLAKAEGIQVHFQPECYDTEIVQRHAPANQPFEEIRKFWTYLLEQKRAGAPISSSTAYLQYISQWKDYSVSSYHSAQGKCAAGSGFLFIDTEGIAYPCAYTKGKTEGLNILEKDWETCFTKVTPCNNCIVGPMLEFNLLYTNPLSAVSNIVNVLQ